MESSQKIMHTTYRGKQVEWGQIFFARDREDQEEVAQYFSGAERNQLSIENPVLDENILQGWDENQDIQRWKKFKMCHQHRYPKRMAKFSEHKINDNSRNLEFQ